MQLCEQLQEKVYDEYGEETIESELARTGWAIPNTSQEDAFEALLESKGICSRCYARGCEKFTQSHALLR